MFLSHCFSWINVWFIDSLNEVWTIFNFYHSFIYFAIWNVRLEKLGYDCTIATVHCQVLDKNVLINFFHPFLSRWKWQSRTIKRTELNWYLWVFSKETSRYKFSYPNYKRTLYVYIMILNSIRMGCKTHVLHHLIINCHISILLKI